MKSGQGSENNIDEFKFSGLGEEIGETSQPSFTLIDQWEEIF
jgi:hypothetical protein